MVAAFYYMRSFLVTWVQQAKLGMQLSTLHTERVLFALCCISVLCQVTGWKTVTNFVLINWNSGEPSSLGESIITLAPDKSVGFAWLTLDFGACDASARDKNHVVISFCPSKKGSGCPSSEDFQAEKAVKKHYENLAYPVAKIELTKFPNGCSMSNWVTISYLATLFDENKIPEGASFPNDCFKWGTNIVYPYGVSRWMKTVERGFYEEFDADKRGSKYYAHWRKGSGNWVQCPANSCMWGTRHWVALNPEWYSEKTAYGLTFSNWYMDEWCACMPGYYAETSSFANAGGYDNGDARPNGWCYTEPAAHDQIVCKTCTDGHYCPGGAVFQSFQCPITPERRYDCDSEDCVFMVHQQPVVHTTCKAGEYVHREPSTRNDRGCKVCERGKYTATANQGGECSCCEPGKFAPDTGQSSCRTCYSGTYSTGCQAECTPCETGKYYKEPTYWWTADPPTECKDCAYGKFAEERGQSVCYDWKTCDDGKYSDPTPSAARNRNCVPCANGKFRISSRHNDEDPLQAKCFDWRTCNPGSYITHGGSATSNRDCSECPPGSFQDTSNQLGCKQCAEGLGSGIGASECSPCGLGMYSVSPSRVCEQCPQGTFWDNVSTANTACTACPPGKYSDFKSSLCYPCPPGHYSNPPNVGCTPCGPGQYADTGSQSRCKDCPAGNFSNQPVNTDCPGICQAGSYAETMSSACTLCPPGTYSSTNASGQCAQCNKGTYSNSTGATSVSTCLPCGRGKHASGTGKSSCTQCPEDHALIASDQGCESSRCVAGKIPLWKLTQAEEELIRAATQCVACYDINADWYEQNAGSCSTCPPCQAGEYRRLVQGASRLYNCQNMDLWYAKHCIPCESCTLGVSYYAQNCSGTQPSSCAPCSPRCAPNEYETQNCTLYRNRNCSACRSKCPDGEYMVSPCNATSDMQCAPCRNCERGWYVSTPCQHSSNRNCTICAPGTYAQATNQPLCVSCSNGTYAARAGSSSCLACAAGTYVSGFASTTCKLCSNGTFSIREGVSSCTACPPGEFLSNSTLGRCELCLAGSFSLYGGTTSCELCQAGTYSPVPRTNATNINCMQCARGYYSPSPNASACMACAPGTFSSETGSTACTPCAPGRFAPPPGAASACLLCGPGNFSNESGAAQCTRCPVGTRSDASVESTGCQACPQGTYASIAGQSACSACSPACVLGSRYESVNCTPATNRACSTCAKKLCPEGYTSNVSLCLPSGFYDCVPCPAYGNDQVHLLSEYSCATCPRRDCGRTPGTYMPWRTACSTIKRNYTLNDTYACARCRGCLYRQYVVSWASCDGTGGSMFELNPENGDLCKACETSCKPGQYIANLCNGRTTRDTEVCADCASCPFGHYHAKPLRGSLYPAFEGEPWLFGYTEDAPCNGYGILNSDGATDCERCDTCPFGKYASNVRRCTGNGIWKDPFNCTDCKPCPSGYEHVAPCDGLSFNDTCKLCPACAAGYHTVSTWNDTLKRMVCGCKRCLDSAGDVCPMHFFKTNATCSGSKPYDEACAPCSLCNSGEYISEGAFCTGAAYEDTSAGKCR